MKILVVFLLGTFIWCQMSYSDLNFRLHILPLMESMKKVLMRYVRSFMTMVVKYIWMGLT